MVLLSELLTPSQITDIKAVAGIKAPAVVLPRYAVRSIRTPDGFYTGRTELVKIRDENGVKI